MEYRLDLEKCWFQASSLQNNELISLLFLFYVEMVHVCTKTHDFVEYTPRKCFNSFLLSAVDARRQKDENPNSSVVAETIKLLGKSVFGYQILEHHRHTVTKYLNDETMLDAINSKLFRKLHHVNHALYQVKLAKSEIEHTELIIVGFLILQYAYSECWNSITTFSLNVVM